MSDAGAAVASAPGVPGVSWRDAIAVPRPLFVTGVPAILGYAPGVGGADEAAYDEPRLLTLWSQFERFFGMADGGGYLAPAVRGFFENGGLACYVVRLRDLPVAPGDALARGLAALDAIDQVDLVCAPDIMFGIESTDGGALAQVVALQQQLLDHCRLRADRFAILDAINTGVIRGPGANGGDTPPVTLADQRGALQGGDGALYHPWLLVPDPGTGTLTSVPPSGHLAGIYSRTDQLVGCHKAPANTAIEGPLDVRHHVGVEAVDLLLDLGINPIRAIPGRGLRVWGARTLGQDLDPVRNQVNVRRLFITVARWMEQFMAVVAFEPNDLRLWLRIMREVSAYCEDLFQRGALKGASADEAFYVKCDGDTNPPEIQAAGMVVTEVGLAPIAPTEFIVVRIVHGDNGVTVSPLGASA